MGLSPSKIIKYNMAMKNKEIEFGVKIANGDDVIKFLEKLHGKPKVTAINRKIYKITNGKYFFKVSVEKSEDQTACVYSMKEDLLDKGIDSGMKISDEIDISVSEEQLSKMEKILLFTGYKVASEFKKVRYEFIIEEMSVTVDKYNTNDYLEIEGESENKINSLVAKIPFIKLNN